MAVGAFPRPTQPRTSKGASKWLSQDPRSMTRHGTRITGMTADAMADTITCTIIDAAAVVVM